MNTQRKTEMAPGIIGRRCEKTAEILEIRRRLEVEGYRIEEVSPVGVRARLFDTKVSIMRRSRSNG